MYRLYDTCDDLVYVGLAVSRNLGQRLRAHRRRPWWSGVTRAATTWHPNFEDARWAEASLIREGKPVHNKRVTTHVPEWNEAGYDLTRTTRFVYAFLRSDGSRVKIGTVSRVERLELRRREVARSCGDHGLRMVAHVAIDEIDSHELEGYEGALQLFLSLAAGLPFGHAVDWLEVPGDSPVRDYDDGQWQDLLDRALATIDTWRENPVDL